MQCLTSYTVPVVNERELSRHTHPPVEETIWRFTYLVIKQIGKWRNRGELVEPVIDTITHFHRKK